MELHSILDQDEPSELEDTPIATRFVETDAMITP